MPANHAKIGPSSFSRVKACPASLRFAAQFPNESNRAADEGTACHEAVERILDGEVIDVGFVAENGIKLTAEHMANVQEVVDWVVDQEFDRLFLEVRVPVGAALGLNDPDLMWGTSDIVGIKGSAMYVCDAKFGFVPVEAEGNAQAMCYLVGALHDISGTFDEFYNVILQPRAGGVKQARVTREQVEAFKDDARAAVTLALSDDAPFNPGEDQCRFCPASGHCKAQIYDEFHDLDEVDTNALTPEELSTWLDKCDHIIATAKAMQAAALQRMLAGQKVPGWEVDQGNGRARWRDEDDVIEEIKAAKLDLDVYAPRKPASQTALKAKDALGAKLVESLVYRPQGEPKLVREGEAKNPIAAEFEALD